MRNSKIKLIQVILLLPINVLVFAQELSISSKTETINVINDSLYTCDITVTINPNTQEGIYPIFYDGKLESISNIKVYEKKGKRYKQINEPTILDENINVGLISSQKLRSVFFPVGTEVKISYTVTCNEIKYFSKLPFFTYYQSDTLYYQIQLPDSYRLYYDIIYKDSLSYLVIDSSNLDNQILWHIKAVPVRVEPDPLMYFGIYKNIKMPLMRTVIIPNDNNVSQKEHFNNWYLHEINDKRGMDSVAKSKIDELTKGLTDSMKIINVLYDYVRTNFKYVAIEIGMGAFIPSHTNEVFVNKQGDCKDLSNFLSEALNYKGIKSNIALAATYNHICDCNFPSICSANHVICIAYLNNKPIILDPTDPIHVPNTPVQSIQERTIFIINPEGGEFYKLNRFEAQNNLINYYITLEINSEKSLMQGEFVVDYTGISGNFLKQMYLDISEDEKIAFNKKFYESIFHNQSVSELVVDNNPDKISVNGKLLVNMKVFNDKDKRYLFLDFLPRLIESEERETLLDGTNLGSTIDKKVKLTIKMDQSFETFQPIKHSFIEGGVSLDITFTNPAESIIECNYELIVDYIFVNNQNQKYINEILNSFNKITNAPLILKNKN